MSISQTIPKKTTVLVIGGGPGGSYAATILAREGIDVTVLERDFFPRYHVGESMLPSLRQFMRLIGFHDRMADHGFTVKPGAAVKLDQRKQEGYTDFIAAGDENGSWNVIRSEFDELLLRYSTECGAHVFEGVKVTDIELVKGAAQSVDWKAQDGTTGTVEFDYLVDASGRTGLMASKYLKSRKFNESLRNVAFWGYWVGSGMYQEGTRRENAPWFEALVDESGWAWFIPLHDGTTSVGVVLGEQASRAKRTKHNEAHGGGAVKEYYLSQLQLAPGLIKLLSEAEFKGDVKTAGDYSYSSTQYAGTNFRLVGDAASFIDPFFSSGVHLAFTGALSAASSIAASIRGDCSEDEAVAFHNAKVGVSYTRFLLVVLGIYKQIGAQNAPVLSSVDSDNFDLAFDMLRPVIQGAADVDAKLTEEELQSTINFCSAAFFPTMLDASGSKKENNFPEEGLEKGARHALEQLDLRKQLSKTYNCEEHFATEAMAGFYARVTRGKLGLVRAL